MLFPSRIARSPREARWLGTHLGTGLPSLPRAPLENNASPQADRASSQGGNTSSPANSRVNNNPQGSSMEEPNPKLVIILSSKPLTPAQRSVLAKGPNFANSPKHPPNLEYITAIESACTKLSQQDAEELRADIN